MSNPTELPDLDRIANDLESEAIPYEGDFADAVRAAIEDIREVAAARRAQPEGEAPQADPYALDDDDVARFPNDANVVIVHKDYYWKLRGCEDVCAALGAEPAAQHAESGAQAAISDTEIHNHLGHWGVLPTKTGEPERVTAGREKLLVTAIQELLSKVYAATRLRDVRSLALEGNRLINGALAAQSQGAHSAPGTPEAPQTERLFRVDDYGQQWEVTAEQAKHIDALRAAQLDGDQGEGA